jgi:hypothetical protein
MVYRQMIELIDGIDTLFRSSCVDATVPVLRTAFEVSLSLDYIMLAEYTQRSLSWTCCYIHARIASHQQLDVTTGPGQAFATARAREEMPDATAVPWPTYDAGPPVDALQYVLARPGLQPIEAEYQRLKQLRNNRAPSWFQFFGGPSNRRELAKAVAREWEYSALYGEWSNFSHAGDASAYIRPGRGPDEAAFPVVRSPQQMPHRAFLAVRLLLRATRVMLDHFRHGEDLVRWYNEDVRDRWMNLKNLRVVDADGTLLS